ncbi:MAG: hypothetical protein V4508_05105 [Pseudomonadota bacterium]
MTVTIHDAIPTEFKNVQVIVLPSIDPLSGLTNYDVTFIPPAVEILTNDAVINYQLIWPTPDSVTFLDMTVDPSDQDQFSEESVGISGRVLTFSDANTTEEVLHITINFQDGENSFGVDPQVINRPPPPR